MASSAEAAREEARDNRTGRFGEQHLADPGTGVLPPEDAEVDTALKQLGNLTDDQFAAVFAAVSRDRIAAAIGATYWEPAMKESLARGLRRAHCQPILIDLDYTSEIVGAELNARGLDPDDEMYNLLMRDVDYEIGSACVGADDAVSSAIDARVRSAVQKVLVERYGKHARVR